MKIEEELNKLNNLNESILDERFSDNVIKAIEITEKKDKNFKLLISSVSFIALINMMLTFHFFDNNIESKIKFHRMQTLILEFSLDK